MKFAQILNNKVHWVGDYDTPPNFNPSVGEFIDITSLSPQPEEGWAYENSSFVEPTPEPSQPELTINIDKTIITADGSDTATVNIELRQDGELSTSEDGVSYFIPILKVDDTQFDLQEIVFSNGQATILFKTTEKSIYSVRFDLIRPIPTAKISTNPEIIAR